MRSIHCLAGSLVLSLAVPAHAEPLDDGPYVLEFGYENAVFGPGSVELEEECLPEGCLAGAFAVDAAGAATGSLEMTFDFEDEGLHVTGGMSGGFSGKVKGKNAVALFKLKSKMAGFLTAPGYPALNIRGSMTVVDEMDAIAQLHTASGSMRLCARGHCETEKLLPETTPFGPPEEDGGPWTLSVSPSTDSSGAITGSATANFPDGSDSIHFVLTGKYDAKQDESTLKLESDVPGPGSKAKLIHVRRDGSKAALAAYKLKYKIVGQTGQQVVP
jgi:hypothetical protein